MRNATNLTSRRNNRRISALALATGGTMVLANLAFADTFTWTRGGGNNNWDNVANWSGGVAPPVAPPGGGTTDILFAGTAATPTTTSALRQDYAIDSLTFAADFIGSGTSTVNVSSQSALLAGATSAHLTIGAGGITSNVTTFNINITRNTANPGDLILSADQTWATNAPAASSGAITVVISRYIKGDFQVTKTGTGVLVMSMNEPNSLWTGGIDLVEGSIRTGGGGSLTALSGQLGTGTVRSTSDNDVTITSSTISAIGGGADRFFDNDLVLGGTGALNFAGSFALNFTDQSTWTLVADKRIGASVSTQHAGTITGNFGFTKESGGMMILLGANDYTGVTTVADGVLQPRNAQALGTTAGGTVVEDGGALELQGGITIAGEALSIAGMGEGTANLVYGIDANAGALRSRSGTNAWTGPVTVTAADTYVAVDTDELNLSGGVVGDGSSSLRAGGAGLLRTANVRAGGLSLDAAARVRINPDGTAAGRSNLGTLGFAGGTAAPTAQLDLGNNALVVEAGGTPVADVAALIAAGRAGGTWLGQGITSSDAAANASTTGVGYAPAGELAGSIPAIFGTVTGDAVLVRYTRLGDANLDGITNIADFSRLAASFNLPGGWVSGDFNYDGLVNIGDFSLLAANFNLSVPATGGRPGAVPEPAGAAALLLLGGSAAARRRQRRM